MYLIIISVYNDFMAESKKSPPEKRSLIKWIYLYLFTAIGLVMFLIGTFNLVQHFTKKYILPKYYLDFQESRCDYVGQQPLVEGKTAGDQEVERKKCLDRLEEERKYQEVLNLSSSLTLIVLGSIVFVFHYRKTQTA